MLKEAKNISILIFMIILAFYLPLILTPLFDLDEGAFSEATREMLVGKDYITTYLNGHLRFAKPILIYWCQLLSIKTFGINEFAFRLPSAIAATFWAFGIYFFTKKIKGEKIAFFASIFMILSLQVNIIAKAAIADSLLNLFITCEMFCIYLFYMQNSKKYLYFTYAFMALGFLTKGPIAILIPFVVSFLFFTIKGRFKDWVKSIIDIKGILIFVAISLPWYGAEYWAQGKAFIDGFFLKNNIGRFDSAMQNHKGSIFYFVPVFLLGMMPYTPYALKSVSRIKEYLKSDLELYLYLWFIFVFLFFSLSGTKLPHYIVYGYTPIFILSAICVKFDIKKEWFVYPLLILLVLLFFTPDLGFLFKSFIKDKFTVSVMSNIYESFGLMYRAIIGIMIITLLLLWKKANKYIFLIGIGFIMIITINFAVLPSYGNMMQEPIKKAAILARKRGYKDIIMYNTFTPSFDVYYRGLVKRKSPESGDIVFTKTPDIKKFSQYKILYKKNGFALIKVIKK